MGKYKKKDSHDFMIPRDHKLVNATKQSTIEEHDESK